ncbi:hypothetical protein ACET3Z_005157 [Daucus carota]
MPMAGSSRWCPTPEQLMILEEIYKGGVRTPNASQIQNITCHLSRYGNIQGKNVFYWFQNHKARDRQKLRKRHFLLTKLQLQQQQQQHNYDHHQNLLFSSTPPIQSHHHHHRYKCPAIPHQGNGGVADASHTLKQSWRTADGPNACEEQSTTKLYKDDNWMMMTMGPDHPTCSNRSVPLKTLQLFPTTSHSTTLI